MWSVGKQGRVWTGDGITVIDDGTWLCIKHEGGYHGLGTSNSVRFNELDGLLKYLTDEDLQHLGWTPLVILSLAEGSPYEFQARRKGSCQS